MKRHYILSLLLCLVLCLSIANAAFGEKQTSAKQLLLNKLKNNGIELIGLPYQVSSGSSILELKKLETNLPDSEIMQLLTNARLKLDSKIDNPAKKLEAKYTLTLNQQDYIGSIFMDSNKLIISTEFMDLIKALEQTPNPTNLTLPRYIYFTGLADARLWDNMSQTEISPAMQELLFFIIEAIPDHYYQLSPDGKKIILHIDRNGLPEVIRALMLKVLAEQERFASLLVNIETTFDPASRPEEDKQVILEALKDLKIVTDTPDSPDKMLEMLGDRLLFDLIIETSQQQAGPGKCVFDLGINEMEGTSANIHISSNAQGSKDNLSGTGLVSFSISNIDEGFSASVKISQDIHLTTAEYRSNSMLDISYRESNDIDTNTYLLLSLQGTDYSKPEKNVAISIPELTPANSMDITEMTNGTAPFHEDVQVVLDGEALSFEVAPLIKDGRTMVPLRDLAEKLGFTVVWSEPNQAIINNGDTTISMFMGEQLYTVNSTQKYLDVAPFEASGRMMVPVRFIAEELGCMVYYSEASNTVFINHKTDSRIIPRHSK